MFHTKLLYSILAHTTGAGTDLAYAALFIRSTEKYQPEAKNLAIAIVTQELKIGITSTSLNMVYGNDFIPKIGCMLGVKLGDSSAVASGIHTDRIVWPCIVTEKLDGIRRILVKEKGICRVYSRSGHEDTGLYEIIGDAAYLPDNTVYDGELLAKGTFKDSIALRQATNSIANSKGAKAGLTFNIFDMVQLDEFKRGQSSNTALVRKITLGATLMDEGIQCLDERWATLIQALVFILRYST